MGQDLDFVYVHNPSQRNEMFGELKHASLPNGNRQVELVIMPGEQAADEFSLNALAIDGSRSMRIPFALHLPKPMRKNQNQVEPLARAVGQLLAKNNQGKTALAYWACGDDGSDIEPVGLFAGNEFESLAIEGPKNMGGGTRMAPIVRYFWEQVFVETRNTGVAVILTDGMWKDQQDLFQLTQTMCDEITAGRRALMKIVILVYETDANTSDLAGIEHLLNELDDYDSGTDVDVWDAKWVNYLSNFAQLFIEPAKDLSLGVGGKVLDASGNVLLAKDELKFGIQFELPMSSPSFKLVLDGIGEFEQALPK